jgi:hypothetical protein
MISLNSYIEQINQYLHKNPNGNVIKTFGLVFPAQRGEENLNVDINGETVFYDDSFDVFAYHRQTSEDINELTGRGKGQLYNIIYTVEMVVFTKDKQYRDFLKPLLKKVPKIKLTAITNPSQSYEILEQETGASNFQFQNTYIFKVTYTLTVMSEECFTVDGIQCHSIGTFPIKVILGKQGEPGNGGLNCDTLADCPIIETIGEVLADHEERIEALEQGGGGGGLTCETLPNCQVIQDIQNEFGNYLPLAGGTMVVFNEFEQSSNNLTGSGFIISDLSVVNTIKAGYYELSNSITGFYKRIVIGNLINNNITINLPDSSGTLALLSDIATALTGYATEAWVNSQGFITNVITALGYTPENVANKATNLTSPDNTKYPTTQAVQTALDLKLSSLYTPLKSGFNIPHTGTAIKTLLNTIPIPPNKFATGDILRINYTISRNTGGAGGVNMICEIGGVVIINQNIAAANQISRGNIDMAIINAANSQRSWGNNTGNAQQNIGVLNVPMTAFTFDFTTALDFQIYGQMTSPSDTIVIESLSIEKI